MKTIYVNERLLNGMRNSLSQSVADMENIGKDVLINQPRVRWSETAARMLHGNRLVGNFYRDVEVFHRIRSVGDSIDLDTTAAEKQSYFSAVIDKLTSIAKMTGMTNYFGATLYEDVAVPLLEDYLNCGALIINSDGSAAAAEDAQQRMVNYCSVTLENAQEEKFASIYSKVRKAYADLRENLHSLSKQIDNPTTSKMLYNEAESLKFVNICGCPAALDASKTLADIITDEFAPQRKNDKPRFFYDYDTRWTHEQLLSTLGYDDSRTKSIWYRDNYNELKEKANTNYFNI
jgi:hypothetical protein